MFYLSTAVFLFLRTSGLLARNHTLLAAVMTLGVAYLAIALVKFRRVNFIHTNLFRATGCLIYLCFVVSFFVEPQLLLKVTIVLLCLSFLESILIFLVFGESDPDVRHLRQLRRKLPGCEVASRGPRQ